MQQSEFQQGDLVILKQDVTLAGVLFPLGTECLVVGAEGSGTYRVEVLEPRREIVSLPEEALEAVQPR